MNNITVEGLGFEVINFPAGEPHVRIKNFSFDKTIIIKFNSMKEKLSHDLFTLAMLLSAIKNHPMYLIHKHTLVLKIGYFPGGRQDRIAVHGDALGVKVYADFINSMEFDHVIVEDPHSDVTPALLRNCTTVPQSDTLCNLFIHQTTPYWLVSPDAGALKKVYQVAKAAPGLKPLGIIECSKKRDPVSGNIIGVTVPETVKNVKRNEEMIVIDDICDGGRSFIELSKVLPMIGPLTLAVSHGIFSQGIQILRGHYQRIFANGEFI